MKTKKMNTQSVDFLNENWDDNTVYRFDNGDRDNSVLYVLSNAPSEIAEKASQMWYDEMEDGEYVSIEACFKKLGYLAVVANTMDKKIY